MSTIGVARWSPQLADNLNKLRELEEIAQLKIGALLMLWTFMGFGMVRVSGARRDLETQRRLYGQGRTAAECEEAGVPRRYADPGQRKCTWCKPEESYHVKGLAVDVLWQAYSPEQWRRALHAARALGVRCGADWKVQDVGHFQVEGVK